MSVTSEITRLYGVRDDIFTAITNKGVTVPSGSQLDDCPTLIGQISGGAPTPPSLPAKTLRLRFIDGITPTFDRGTGVQVTSSPNVWDWTYNAANWQYGLANLDSLISVDAAGDTSGVTGMEKLFNYCKALQSVCLFDTSNVTTMKGMFYNCYSINNLPTFNTSSVQDMELMFNSCISLYTVPLFSTGSVTNMNSMFVNCSNLHVLPAFDTSSVTDMSSLCNGCSKLSAIPLLDTDNVANMEYAFYSCEEVQSGALALYQQASSQTTPPSTYNDCFYNCGVNTQTGAAELAQIPSSWGGTAS